MASSRSELDTMKIGALKQKAISLGAVVEDLERENTKEDLINLILALSANMIAREELEKARAEWKLDEHGQPIGDWFRRLWIDPKQLGSAPMHLRQHADVVLEAVKYDPQALQFAAEELIEDRDFVIRAVRCDGLALQYASEQLRGDRDIVLVAIRHSWGQALQFASLQLRSEDESLVLEAVRWSDGNAMKFAGNDLKENRNFVLDAIERSPLVLEFVSDELRNDAAVVLHATRLNRRAFQFAGNLCQGDDHVVLKSLENSEGLALEFAPMILRSKRHFMLEAIKYPICFTFASDELVDDRKFVLEAIEKSQGEVMKFVRQDLREEREFVLDAVRVSGQALKHVESHFRSDLEVVQEAIRNDARAFQYASYGIRHNREVVLEAIRRDWHALEFVERAFRKNVEVVIVAVKLNFSAIQLADKSLLADPGFVLSAMKWHIALQLPPQDIVVEDGPALAEAIRCSHGMAVGMPSSYAGALEYTAKHFQVESRWLRRVVNWCMQAVGLLHDSACASPRFAIQAAVESWIALHQAVHLTTERDVLLETVSLTSGRIFEDLPEHLRSNPEFAIEAVKRSWLSVKYMDESLRGDRAVVLEAIKHSWGQALQFATLDLASDRAIVLEAVRLNGQSFQYAADSLRADKEFVLEAIRLDPFVLQYACGNLSLDLDVKKESIVGFRTFSEFVQELDENNNDEDGYMFQKEQSRQEFRDMLTPKYHIVASTRDDVSARSESDDSSIINEQAQTGESLRNSVASMNAPSFARSDLLHLATSVVDDVDEIYGVHGYTKEAAEFDRKELSLAEAETFTLRV